ncbi:MAG: hypothetical protein ACETVN_02925 [Asgard group archaeon]
MNREEKRQLLKEFLKKNNLKIDSYEDVEVKNSKTLFEAIEEYNKICKRKAIISGIIIILTRIILPILI